MSGELFRILLVEDSSADVYLFRKALANAELNCDLMVIADGAEALSYARGEGKYRDSFVPDLAILDLSLPKNGGAEVLAAIRKSDHLSQLAVVVTSSSTSPRDRTTVELLGIERYIVKPLDLDDFLQIGMTLREILLRRRPPAPAS